MLRLSRVLIHFDLLYDPSKPGLGIEDEHVSRYLVSAGLWYIAASVEGVPAVDAERGGQVHSSPGGQGTQRSRVREGMSVKT